MNTRQIVVKNTILQIFLQFFNLFTGLYSISLIARYLGKAAFGKYGFISSFYIFFISFLDLGIGLVAVREVAREKEKAGLFLNNIVTLRLFLAILFVFLAIAIANIYPFPADLRLALSLYAPVLLFVALQSIQAILQANLRYEYIVLSSFFWRISSLLFLILTVRLNLGLSFIVISFLLAEAVKCLILYLSSRKFVNIKLPVIDIKLWIEMVRKALPIGITTILITVIRNIDVMMLTKMKGFTEVGLYLAPYRLCDMSLSLPLALMGSIFPLMSKFYKQDFSALKRIYQKTFDILSVCGILITILVLALSDKIILLLFGAGFIKSVACLRILIFYTLLVYLSISSGNLLIVIDKQKFTMWLCILGAPLNIILNLILIPRFSFMGAAVSNVTVSLLFTLLTFYFISVKVKMPLEVVNFKKAAIAGLASLAVLFCLRNLSIFISMPIGILVYTFLIIHLKTLDKEDIKLLFKREFGQNI